MTDPNLVDSKRKVGVLSRLLEVSKKINSTLEMPEVVSNIIASAKDVMQADSASLLLMHSSGEHLTFEVALGESSQPLTDGQTQIQLGEGIAGWVADSATSLKLDDVYQDERFSQKYDELTGYRTRSMLCVPLKVGGKVIGVAQVINKMAAGGVTSFSEEDVETFDAFCGMAAIAVDKAKLHKHLLEKQRLEKEIELAQVIQQSFLTQESPQQDQLRFAAINIPALKVGGDFYDIFEFGEEAQRRIGVTIGDVSGKGVFAALYMARFMSDFRFLVELAQSPAEAICRANNLLVARSTRGMFITMLYIEYDPETQSAILFNAGHHPPILYSADRQRIEPFGKLIGPPLGIMHGLEYEPDPFQLSAGAGLLLYTDGVTEARNAAGQEYGLDRMIEQARQPTETLMEQVLADIRQFIGAAPQHDDLTLVVIEATGSK